MVSRGERRMEEDNNANTTGPISPSSSPTGDQQCFPANPKPGDLVRSSYVYYEALYAALNETGFNASQRVGSIEVVNPENAPLPFSIDTQLKLLRVIALRGFTAWTRTDDGKLTLVPRDNSGLQSYGDSTGLLLAIHHFNNGIGSIVKEIDGINETCPIRFVADNFYDTEHSQVTAVDTFGRLILDYPDRPPAALFGAFRSAVSIPLAILSGAYEIPQISPLSTSTELDDTSVYRYFSRLIPSDAGTAEAASDYLRSRLDLTHLAVLYVNDAYGSAYNQAIREACAKKGITVKGVPFSYNNALIENAREETRFAVEQLAASGYKVVFAVLYDEHFEVIMNAAYEEGIVGPGYLWIVSDGLSETYLQRRKYPAGSRLAIAAQGIGILKAEGGRASDENTGFDRFTKVWFDQREDAVSYYNCKQPTSNTAGNASLYYKAGGDFFEKKTLHPTAGAVFHYDSLIAMGLAACELANTNSSVNGTALFNKFIQQSFDGATGQIVIDPETTSRDPKSAFFVLYNADGTTEGGETTFRVRQVSHTVQNANSTSVVWTDIDGQAFVYSDGTTQPPETLPPIEGEDLNQLSRGMRGAGLALAGIILAGSVYFACWTFYLRKERVVRASQPIFLQMICLGTLIMGSTIITLSIDDRVASLHGCDIACMMNPWLLTYGFVIIFSALFSKTWRINKIFHHPQLRRIKVTPRDVMLPFVILLSLNTVVLVVWTVLSPLAWERVPRSNVDEFNRVLESYGTCTTGDDFVPYVVLLVVINFAVLVLANFQAYQARAIATEYSESRFIAIIMASILQASCIGLPLVILVDDDPPASFFVRTGIIFVVCMSTLLFVFIPKMRYLKEYNKRETRRRTLKMERAIAHERAVRVAEDEGFGNAGAGGTEDTCQSTAIETAMAAGQRVLVENDSSKESMNEDFDSFDAAGGCQVPLGVSSEAGFSEQKRLTNDDMLQTMKENDVRRKHVSPLPTGLIRGRLTRHLSLPRLIASTGSSHHKSEKFHSSDTSDFDSGIEIISHPLLEKKEVKVLKAEAERMEQQKSALTDKMRSLRVLLADGEIDSAETLLQSIIDTLESRHANRTADNFFNDDDYIGDSNLPARGRSHRELTSNSFDGRRVLFRTLTNARGMSNANPGLNDGEKPGHLIFPKPKEQAVPPILHSEMDTLEITSRVQDAATVAGDGSKDMPD